MCDVRYYCRQLLTRLTQYVNGTQRDRFNPTNFMASLHKERFDPLLKRLRIEAATQSCLTCRREDAQLAAAATANAAHFGKAALPVGVLATMIGDHIESAVGFAVEVVGDRSGPVLAASKALRCIGG